MLGRYQSVNKFENAEDAQMRDTTMGILSYHETTTLDQNHKSIKIQTMGVVLFLTFIHLECNSGPIYNQERT